MSAAGRGATAATAYAYHQGVVLQLLERARVALDAHQLAAAASPLNWGYAGDVGAAADRLLEVLAGLEVASAGVSFGVGFLKTK